MFSRPLYKIENMDKIEQLDNFRIVLIYDPKIPS